jgi:hypothetical protein
MGLIDSIIGAESGGDPNAKNPNSSASGPGQFIDSTFLDVIRKARPDLANQSDADLLALKTDPTIGRQATEAYAAQNGQILSNNGLPVTPGTTYLAHFAGPGGAVKVLQADPNASVGDILGAGVVKANPFLAGMSARDLQAWAERKMGGSPVQTASATPASPVQSIPQQPQPMFAPQAQAAPQQASASGLQIPTAQAPPIFFAPRKPIDLATLKAAFAQPNFYNRG